MRGGRKNSLKSFYKAFTVSATSELMSKFVVNKYITKERVPSIFVNTEVTLMQCLQNKISIEFKRHLNTVVGRSNHPFWLK